MNVVKKISYSAGLLVLPLAMQAAKPNFVFMVVDDLGWKDFTSYGSDFHQTSAIDSLASDGVLFTDAYATCTVSSPSRASLMTGKYPATLNVTDWIEGWKMPDAKLNIPDWTMYLPVEELTLADIFKRAGYKTVHIGKWHLGETPEYWPEHHGFDINIGGWAKGSPHRNKQLGYNGYFTPYGNPRMEDGPEGEYLTERLAEEACKYIEASNQDEPFYMNLWFYNVHTPLMAKKDKIDKYNRLVDREALQRNPTYAAMVEHVDDAVRRVVQTLKEKGIYDNTIIILTSDNGGLIGRGANKITNNYPLRSGKGDMYEGGVRIPFIVKNLNQTKKGSINNSIISFVDVVPTVVDMMNLPVTEAEKEDFDGVSLKTILTSNKNKLKRTDVYWHYPHYHIEGAVPYSAVRDGDWKLLHIYEDDSFELYNLKKDIGETTDLSAKHPKRVKKLNKKLEDWKKQVAAQIPTPNPNYKGKK